MKAFRTLLCACSVLWLAGPGTAADAPAVAASIKPVHALVAAVMDGVGRPALIVPGTGSEHAYALRPSDADALARAGIVFWISPDLETFLTKPIATLAPDAVLVALAETPGLEKLPQREGGPFEAHEHEADDHGHEPDHDHEAGHDHGHDDDDRHAHDEQEAAEDGHHHAHGAYDMHVWLDPQNARAMVEEIARKLAEADPANAARYAANASAYAERLVALEAEIDAELAAVKDRPFIVFHDAYQYFERRFGVRAVGAITVNPEVMPGARRVAEIKARVKELGAVCVFAEPQFEPRLVRVVTEGTEARAGMLDPLGAEIPEGPDLYPELIRTMATSLKSCLSDAS